MKFILIVLLSLSAALADHRGGNGGHPIEISLKNRLMKVAHFVMQNSSIFGEISEINWALVANGTTLKVVDEELIDQFGSKRCATNFAEKGMIYFNRSCFNELQYSGKTLNSLLAHELFNLRGFETPVDGSSVYTYSEKFLTIEKEISINVDQLSYLSSNCSIEVKSSDAVTKVTKGIIQLKGFKPKSLIHAEFVLHLSPGKALLERQVIVKNEVIKVEKAWSREFETQEENAIELPVCVSI